MQVYINEFGQFSRIAYDHTSPYAWETVVECDTEPIPGSTWNGENFVAPAAVTQTYPKLSPPEFKLLFTSAERIAIKQAKLTDPVLEDAFEILEDPRLKEVDLGLTSNQQLIGYMVTQGLLTEARAEQIKAGVVL